MAFFASLFWVSFFMQDAQKLSPLNVGIRLLPQAVVGLVVSPSIGWWMHKMDNMLILVAAAVLQAGACALLLFLHSDSNYFAFIFPSLILSTIGYDWVRNVGAVSNPSLSTVSVPFPLSLNFEMITCEVAFLCRPLAESDYHFSSMFWRTYPPTIS